MKEAVFSNCCFAEVPGEQVGYEYVPTFFYGCWPFLGLGRVGVSLDLPLPDYVDRLVPVSRSERLTNLFSAQEAVYPHSALTLYVFSSIPPVRAFPVMPSINAKVNRTHKRCIVTNCLTT